METTTKPDVKLCKNCKHAKPAYDYDGLFDHYECQGQEPYVNLVTGTETYLDCYTVRPKLCKGEWYEPKPVAKSVSMLKGALIWISNKF